MRTTAASPTNVRSWSLGDIALDMQTCHRVVGPHGGRGRDRWATQTGTSMIAPDTSTKLHLDPPGPGSWEQDPVHFPRPMTRYFQETHPAPFKKGTNDFARFYGMLIDGLQIGYVNGFAYNQVLPAPDAEVPERFKRAEQVF